MSTHGKGRGGAFRTKCEVTNCYLFNPSQISPTYVTRTTHELCKYSVTYGGERGKCWTEPRLVMVYNVGWRDTRAQKKEIKNILMGLVEVNKLTDTHTKIKTCLETSANNEAKNVGQSLDKKYGVGW